MNLDPKVLKDLYGDQEPMVNPFPEARKYNPQDVAKGIGIQQTTGVDAILASQRLPEFQEELDQNYWNKLVSESPKTAKFLSASPVNAALLQPDADSGALSTIAAAVKYLVSAPGTSSTLMGDIAGAYHGGSSGVAGAFGAVSRTAGYPLDWLDNTSMPGGNPLRRLSEGFMQIADQQAVAKKSAEGKSKTWLGGAVSSGVQSLGQNLMVLPMAFLPGGQAAALTSMAAMSGGQTYQKDMADGVPHWKSMIHGTSDAAIEAGTEMLPLGGLVQEMKAGTPLMTAILKNAWAENKGEQVATVLQDLNDWAINDVNKGKTFGDYLADRPAAAAQTLIATLIGAGGNVTLMHGVQGAVDRASGVDRRAQVAEQHATVLDGLQQTMQATEVLKTNPATLTAYMQELTDDGVPQVFVDSAKLVEAGINLQELAAAVPSVAAQLDQVQTGGDLVIPTGELLTSTIGSAFAQPLIDNARTDVNGMSRAEAKDYMAEKGDKINAEIERVLAERQDDATFKEGRDQVQGQILQQLNTIKRFTPKVNEQYAALASNFYAVMAARTGMTVQDFAGRYKLGFDANTAQGSQVLDQPGTPAFNNWFGGSKVVDAQGEPLMVYHGSVERGVTEFDTTRVTERSAQGDTPGTYFTGSQMSASGYTRPPGASIKTPRGEIVPAYLSIQNPLNTTAAIKKYRKQGMSFGDAKRKALEALTPEHDGIIFEGDSANPSEYVVFNPTQIKSATGNNGNYDATDPNILHQNTFNQSANALEDSIAGEGGEVKDVLQIDQLVDSSLIPTITVQDMVGKNIFPTIADRTAAAALYTGIDSSQLEMAVPLLGGPFFPLRQSNFNKIAWANRGKGVSSQKAAKLKDGANYMLVVMGDANMHQSNSTVAAAFVGTLEAWAKDGRISAEGVEALGKLVNETGAKSVDDFKAKLAKAEADLAAAQDDKAREKAEKSVNIAKKAIVLNQYLEGFPGFDDSSLMHTYMDGISFDARKRILDLMGGKAAQEMGAPPMQMILDATREPSLAGHRWGDGVILLEVDQENHQVDLGTDGTQAHPDFPVGIRGRVVGKLDKAVSWELLWQDWLSENSDKASPRRAFELAKPVVSVTQDLADRIGEIKQENIDAARQARLAADFAAGNWRTSDDAVNKGGISPQEFVDAIQASTAKTTLTPYTIEEVTAGIKDGSMKLYQLGDGQIFFMLKTEGGKKILASVVNNEQGARGIGGPAVVLKSIQEGATDLDCFAVKSEKFPHGFLPSLYSAFGFRVDTDNGPYDYDAQYFPGLKEADAVKYWKESTPGFDPEKGMPQLAYMTWKGTEDERAGIIDRYLRTGFKGLYTAGISLADGSTMSGLRGAAGAEAEGRQSAAPNGDGSAGDQGAAAGASVSSRARLTVQGIAKLGDNELKNLGLTAQDRDAVRTALGLPIYSQDARGQIAFGNDITQQASIISLLKNADLSTFIHESGHFFLEVQADLASRIAARIAQGEQVTDGEKSILDDFTTTLKWMGVTGDQDISAIDQWALMTADEKRPHHEQFARGFEAYAFEGKAPSLELQSVFQTFRAWLVNVYRTVKDKLIGDTLNVQLNDEVRAVMDRMLATTDAIQEAEAARSMGPLFKSAEEGGMDLEAYKLYHDMGTQATQDAIQELQGKGLRDMQWLQNARSRKLKELQKQHDALRAQIAREVRAEVMSQPIYQVWAFLTSKTGDQAVAGVTDLENADLSTAAGKLRTQVLRDMYGTADDAIWRKLSALRMTSDENGLHPDLVAERFGFQSGDELVQKLTQAEPPQSVIEGRTDQRMLEEHGDLATPAGLERAADAAIHNDARVRFVATELRALQHAMSVREKVPGQKNTVDVLARAAREHATALIARLKVRDIRPAQYAAAEARAAKAAEKARGDLAKQTEAKRNQLINLWATKAAYAAQDEVKAAIEYFKKFDKVSKSLDPEYQSQIHALLERFDLRQSVSLKEIEKRKSLVEWVADQVDQGLEPNIPPGLLQEANRKSFKEMTVEEIRGLRDTIKQIEHLGRLKNKLLTAQEQRDFAQAVAEITGSIAANANGRTAADTRTPNTLPELALQSLKNFWASHIKAATWARVMDGGKDGGKVWEYLIRTANDAGNNEVVMREKATKELAKLVAPVLKQGKMGGKGVHFDSIKRTLNREAVLAIALNVGNASNLQRLLGGESWNVQQILPVLDTLTAEEWQFVQAVWDHFESYRPQIAAKETRVYGKEPDWVEPTPVQTKFGVLRGGYYPVKFDPRASGKAEMHADAEAAKQQLKGAYTSATTRRSFTKTRVEEVNGRPLLYSLDGIYNGVQEVIHDLTWHEWLIDANKLLRNKSVDASIRSTYGPDVVRQFKDWVADNAEGGRGAQGAGEMAAAWVRQGVSVSGLGLNVMSALMQPLGLTQSIVRIGPKWVARGISKAIGSPLETADAINEKSEFMRTRALTRLREIAEVRSQVKGRSQAREAVDASAYFLMMRCQQLVDVPTWWGAYEKAIAEGNNEDRAVALSDQAVIDAQGSGGTKDQSAIERGGPIQKLFTVFYSFFNTALNLGVGQTMTHENKAKLAADYLLLFTVPALLGAVLKDALTAGDSGDWDDPEKMLKRLIGEQISFLMGLMVGVREMAGAVQAVTGTSQFGTDYSGPAGTRFLADLVKLGKQIHQGEMDDGLRKAIVNTTGELLRLPSAQINRTITGAKALADGKTSNPGVLLTGYQEPH